MASDRNSTLFGSLNAGCVLRINVDRNLEIVKLTVMAKIPGHGRIPLTQREREALIEMVARCDTVRNDLGLAVQYVAGHFLKHGELLEHR